MRAAGNPGGIGHLFIRERFIDPLPEDATDREISGKENRIFIPSTFRDNPFLDQDDYEESLMELDPVERAQLMNGDWDIAADGNMFKPEWFDNRIISELPHGVTLRRLVRYWDLASTDEAKAIKDKGDPDYTASVLQGLGSDGNIYILEITRDRLSPAGVEKLVRSVAERDGRTGVAIWLEQEPGSSGVNTIHTYRKLLLGFNFRGDRPTGNKIERARTASAACENGLVYIIKGAKTKEFLAEAQAFPMGAHDDMVDAFSAGLLKIAESADIGKPVSTIRKKRRGIWD
jgi:predicted phage terminase large subunit-like protein